MKLKNMSWPAVREAAPSVVAVLPLGAIEQHGPHLAVSTDAGIVSKIADAVEERLGDSVVLAPTLVFGSSHHHLHFPGTMSLRADLYTQVLLDLVRSLVAGGFRRIVLFNGHGGNVTPARQALSLASHEFDPTVNPNIALATYWELAGKSFAGAPPMESPALSHSCEYETSLMLHLFPERVRMEAARRAARPASNGYIPWEDDEPSRGVTMIKKTEFISSNGSSGEPHKGTAAKGAHLFGAAVEAAVEFVASFKDWPLMEDLRSE
jgi:creatinine amidohydrolase